MLTGHDNVFNNMHVDAITLLKQVGFTGELHGAVSKKVLGWCDGLIARANPQFQLSVCLQQHLQSPINWASQRNHVEIMRLLVNNKADLNLQTGVNTRQPDADFMVQNERPIDIAVAKGYTDIVRVLIDAKADVHARNAKVRP